MFPSAAFTEHLFESDYGPLARISEDLEQALAAAKSANTRRIMKFVQ